MPNALAMLAMLIWPMITLVLFARLTGPRAFLATIYLGYLFLPPAPAGFNIPIFRPLTKDTWIIMCALLGTLMFHSKGLSLLPQSKTAKALVLIYIFSPIATVISNSDQVFFGAFILPALTPTEAISTAMKHGVAISALLLARHYLARFEDQRDLLIAAVLAVVAYALPMLMEIRLSPQLNTWIYGFFQHSFEQMMREGGFRPIVFLYHGLWVAFLTMTGVVAAAALMKQATGKWRKRMRWVTAGLLGLLILCKSLASLIYALILLPIVVMWRPKWQLSLALLLGVVAFSYPLLRASPLFPREAIIERVVSHSEDRAGSLEFRFINEELLLDRANERPLLGWGLWGRNHLLDPSDGRIQTVTDGRWIIVLGMWGWIGYIAEFGALLFPIGLAWYQQRRAAVSTPWIGPMALLLAVNVVDLLPNATLTPLTWVLAGCLLRWGERPFAESLEVGSEVKAPRRWSSAI